MKHEHREILLAKHDPNWGQVLWVHQTPFNRNLLYDCCIPVKGEYEAWPHRMVWKGKPLFDFTLGEDRFKVAVSPSGEKIALAKVNRGEERGKLYLTRFDITVVNDAGEKTVYRVENPNDHDWGIVWFSDTDLVWCEDNWSTHSRGLTFKNGEEVFDERFWFTTCSGGDLISDPRVNRKYFVKDNGVVKDMGEATPVTAWEWSPQKEADKFPTIHRDKSGVYVEFKGNRGPKFLGIKDNIGDCDWYKYISEFGEGMAGGQTLYSLNATKDRIIYCGIVYDQFHRAKLLPLVPLEIAALISIAFLGFDLHGEGLLAKAHRFVPVNNQVIWKARYRLVKEMIFAGEKGMAVIASHDRKTEFVAVDEEEGPIYDYVCNLCPPLPGSNEVLSYIARRGNNFFRVEVY